MRACSIADFLAALEGWAEAHGGAREKLSDDDRAELGALMERY